MAHADPCPEFRPLANIDKRHLVFDGDTFRQDPLIATTQGSVAALFRIVHLSFLMGKQFEPL